MMKRDPERYSRLGSESERVRTTTGHLCASGFGDFINQIYYIFRLGSRTLLVSLNRHIPQRNHMARNDCVYSMSLAKLCESFVAHDGVLDTYLNCIRSLILT